MAEPRPTPTARGTRVIGERARRKPDLGAPEEVTDPTRPRRVVDYALRKRATLEALYAGRVFDGADICDADPYLIRAARFHGTVTGDLCPVCRLASGREALTHVTYIHGDQLGHLSGSAVDPHRLGELAPQYGEFRVHVVEVCTTCHWNHLVTSYVLGDGVPRKPPPKPRDLID